MNIDKRIAIFLPSLRGGGVERAMSNLARGFVKQGILVDMLLSKAEGPYLYHLPKEIRIIDLGTKRVLACLPKVVRYLYNEKPYSMISAMNHTNIVALWAKLLAGAPTRIIVSVHSTLGMTSSNASSLRERIMPFMIKMHYPWADAIIAVSHGVAEDLIRATGLPRKKVRVIYNPVIMPEMQSMAEKSPDHPWFASGQPPVILSVGRLTSAKDYAALIRAFAIVHEEIPVRLMILGEGQERSKLEFLIHQLRLEQDVSLPGFVENPYQYIRRASVFVLSSRWEGLPTVLIEALALGTPIVSTNCPSGPSEILENGRFGKLVPTGNISKLADAIRNTLYDNRSRPNNILFEPTPSITPYMLENAVRKYLDVLEDI